MNKLKPYLERGTRELTAVQVSRISIKTTPMNAQEQAIYDCILSMLARSHGIAKARGWYKDHGTGAAKERNFGEVIALMHSELSEALEADRKGLMDDHLPWRPGVEVEFADTFIRISDTAQARADDVAGAFIEKCRFNMIREDHDLASRGKTGGKKY